MTETVGKGYLKLLLGYAPGVGKTFSMLEEARKLKEEGVDLVIGYLEPHGRQAIIDLARGLEVIPRRKIIYRGSQYEEMDTEAILQRHPKLCVVDEFAHTNVPGSRRPKRWEDVRVLLESGIDVLANLNVQHLESLNDAVWEFSGLREKETVPDWVVNGADEVVMVDLPPQALLNRLGRGVIYPPEEAQKAREKFFTEPSLVTLRELTLRQAAHEVDVRQETRDAAGLAPLLPQRRQSDSSASKAESSDKLLIHITADPSTAALIRRGRRMADYLDAECFAVFVNTVHGLHSLPFAERHTIERQLNFARNLQIETRILQGVDVAETLVDFARSQGITQLFVLRTHQKSKSAAFGRNLFQQIVWLARDMQVMIVAEHRSQES